MGDIAGIPRRVITVVLGVLSAEVVWVLWVAFAHAPLWLPLVVCAATLVPVLVAAFWRTGAASVLNAMARSALAIAAGQIIGVPVLVVLVGHVRWAAAWQEWSPTFIVISIFGVACLLLSRLPYA